jgi:MFS transporter, DHA2 family, multidrug resistance protein
MTSALKPAHVSDTTRQGRYRQPSGPERDHPDRLEARLYWIAVVCVVGAMPSLLDTTVVAVAQRTFISQFHSTQAVVAWTMTGYTLALAAVIPLTGWAADRFGTKRLFIGSIVLFTAGSLLCAMAPSISLLVTFRVLQGLGGGMVMPLTFTILTREAGPTRLGRLAAVLGIPMLLGPVFGPILGGWLVDSHGWRSIFLINLPLGVLAVVLAAIVFDRDRPAPSESFDILGVLLLSPGLAAFLYGFSSIPQRGTAANPHVWLSVTIGLVLIIGFVLHALRAERPLIDMRLFANRTVTVANAAMVFYAAGFYGAGLLLPSYFQQLLHHTPMQSGLHLIPEGIGAMLAMPIAAQVMDRRGPGRIVLVGVLLTCAGMGIFAYGTSTQAGYAPVLAAGLAIIGMGMGCTFMTMSAAAVVTLKPEQVARGSTLINVNQRLGGSIGTALTSIILTTMLNRSPNVAAANKLAALHEQATKRGVPVPRSAMPPQALLPDFANHVAHDMAHAYTVVFLTVAALVALTCIPAVLLPKRPVERPASQRGVARVDPQDWPHAGTGPGSAPLPPPVGWRVRFRGTGVASARVNDTERDAAATPQPWNAPPRPVGWRAVNGNGAAEARAGFDGAVRADTAEQQRWIETKRWIETIRVDRERWQQPGPGPGGAPVSPGYGNGIGEARAGFDGAATVDSVEQQRWIGTYRVDPQGWQQPGAGPAYRQSALPRTVGWRARFREIPGAVAGVGHVPSRTRKSVGVPRKSVGVPHNSVGVPHKSAGLRRKSVGVPRTSVGVRG